MREITVATLVLLCCLPAASQTAPAVGKQVIKDAKGVCQIEVPSDWVSMGETSGAAIFRDSTTGIAVVTAQPGQEFKPLTPAFLKTIGIPKEKLFENSATRLYYQDKTSTGKEDASAFSASIPVKGGTCSCHVVVLPEVTEDAAKKIVGSLAAGKT